MKRIASLAIALFLIVACFAVSVSADAVTATLSSANANRGGTATLSVSITGSTQYTNGSISFALPEGLTINTGDWNLAMPSPAGMSMADFTPENGKGVFTLDAKKTLPAAADQYGKIFEITLDVASDATYGDNTVSVTLVLKDKENNEVYNNTVTGTVTVACPHTNVSYTSDEDGHTKVCADCGKELAKKEAHKYPSACAPECSVCGYTRDVDSIHVYDTTAWKFDEQTHWHECKNCHQAKSDEASHNFSVETVSDDTLKSAATLESPAIYYKSCECGAISTSDNDTFENGDPVSKGEETKEASGISLPEDSEDTLYENMELVVSDATSGKEITQPDKEVMDTRFGDEDAKIAAEVTVDLQFNDNGKIVGGQDIPEEATITFPVDKKSFKGFKDVKVFAQTTTGEYVEQEGAYDEATGTVTFTVPAGFTGLVTFVGTPTANNGGDSTNLALWIVLAAIAMLGTAAVVYGKKRVTR